MRKKITILILSCIFCASLISVGVFAASYLKLNVVGTIDFIAYDKLVYIEQVEVKNFVESSDGGLTYDAKTKVLESCKRKYLNNSQSIVSLDIASLSVINGEWLTIEISFISLYEKDLWVVCQYNNLENLTIATNSIKLQKNLNGDIASGTKSVFCISIKHNNTGVVSLQDVGIDISFVEVPEINASGEVTNLIDTKYIGVSYTIDETQNIASAKANASISASEVVVMGEVIKDGVLYPVTSLENQAFADKTGLVGAVIMGGVDKLDYYSFSGCTGLVNVVFPGSLTQLNEHSFSGCTSLKTISLPNAVNLIASNAFYNCTGLKYVTRWNDEVETVATGKFGGNVFNGCSSLISVEIPESITTLENTAFSSRSSLEKVIMSDNVTKWGTNAFFGCTKLSFVTIPSSLTTCGTNVLYNCTSLTSVNLPEGLTKIFDYMFCCTGIQSIVLPSTIQQIGYMAFSECYDLVSITLNNGLQRIGGYAFELTTFKSIVIPSTVTYIEDYVFSECYDLESVTMKPTTPPTLGDESVFDDTTATIYVPSGSLSAYTSEEYWSEYAARIVEQ